MSDEENLYFLADVFDETAQPSSSGVEPYSGDSIELFLFGNPAGSLTRNGGAFQPNGRQIVFDTSRAGAGQPFLVKLGKAEKLEIPFKLLRKTEAVDGIQRSGYVLEAAIPWTLLPEFRAERGKRFAFNVKLNDSNGISFSTAPSNSQPYANCRGFRTAYLEQYSEDRVIDFSFPAVAVNAEWPEHFQTAGKIWDDAFTEKRTPDRASERLYLNGLWATQAAAGEGDMLKPDSIYYTVLPLSPGPQTPVFERKGAKLTGKEVPFTAYAGKNTSFFWYERTVEVPASWRGRQLRFVSEYTAGEALLFINGKPAGILSRTVRSADVTNLLKPGEINRIDLRTFGHYTPQFNADNGRSGLTGDLYLEARPEAAHFGDVRIGHASGLTGEFSIDSRMKPGKNGTLTLELRDPASGKVVHTQKQSADRTRIAGRFAGFLPWSPESPKLYDFVLSLRNSDGKLLDERIIRSGFRTFETKNARFYLNGKPFRFRSGFSTTAVGVVEPGRLERLKEFGFNAIYFDTFGSSNYEPLFEKFDEYGFVAFAPVSRAASADESRAAVDRAVNHPSVLGYISDAFGQLDVNGFIHHPFVTDDTFLPDSRGALDLYQTLLKRKAFFEKLDPSRFYVPQGTGNWCDIMRITHQYPGNDLSLVDRLRYQEPWAKRKNPKLPLYIYEAGTLMLPWFDCTHPDHKMVNALGWTVFRFLMHEAAGRYFGDRAFENWRLIDRLHLQTMLRNFRLNGVDGFTGWWVDQEDIFLEPQKLPIRDDRQLAPSFLTRPYREVMTEQWMRLSSAKYTEMLGRGAVLESFPAHYGLGTLQRQPSLYTDIYLEENQPFCAILTGNREDRFDLAHNFYAGTELAKQLVLVNDTEKNVSFTGTATLTVDGKQTEQKQFDAQVAPGEIRSLLVNFALPQLTEKERAASSVVVTYADPVSGRERQSRFDFTLFGDAYRPAAAPVIANLALFGDSPLTAKWQGRRIKTLSRETLQGVAKLVIAPGALNRNVDGKVLADFIADGGAALFFSQDDAGLLSHELHRRYLEQGFFTDAAHPVAAGLEDGDLGFWQGAAESVPATYAPGRFYRNNQSAALDTPRLSNRNIVAGFSLDNPHYGAIRPIVTGGFGRADALLIESRSGKGRAIFCQLDLAEHYGVDPAATRLADNLAGYFAELPVKETTLPGVRYAGNEAGGKFLSGLGIAAVADSPVAVFGAGASAQDIENCDAKCVVLLPGAPYEAAGIERKEMTLHAPSYPDFFNKHPVYSRKSNWPGTDFLKNAHRYFSGLSAFDCYFFSAPKVGSFSICDGETLWKSERGTLAVFRKGDVEYIAVGYDPVSVKSGDEKANLCRIYSVLFANLGIANSYTLPFTAPATDYSDVAWSFVTDYEGKGVIGNLPVRKLKIGKNWEEQGVTEKNPNVASAPDSAYDGAGIYFLDVEFSEAPQSEVYLHLGRVRDIFTFDIRAHQTVLYVNGKKMTQGKAWNAYRGGRGGRLFTIPAGTLKAGKNRIAVSVFNTVGPGGIDRKPARIEFPGRNPSRLWPYEFNESKYSNYAFWCW